MTSSLSYLSEALPIAGRALSLRESFNKSLIESFEYLLEACKEAIPQDQFKAAFEKLTSLNTKEKISGFLSALHSDFLAAIEKEDVNRVKEVTEQLVKHEFQIQEMTYKSISELDDYYVKLTEGISSQEIIEVIEFAPLPADTYEKVKLSIQRGYDVLKRIAPDFYNEAQELVSEILVLNSLGVKQGTSLDLFGTIFKSSRHNWQRLTDILECIIHEQSHLYVHLLSKDDPLVLNPTERFESPLRKESRPLMGIFHATFVLSRIHYILEKALKYNQIPADEAEYCHELMSHYNKRYHVGVEVLNKHAKMTPLGKELIRSSAKLL